MAKFNQWRYLDAYANAADLADRRNYTGYTFGRTDTSSVDENDINLTIAGEIISDVSSSYIDLPGGGLGGGLAPSLENK